MELLLSLTHKTGQNLYEFAFKKQALCNARDSSELTSGQGIFGIWSLFQGQYMRLLN